MRLLAALATLLTLSCGSSEIVFHDVQAQTREFMAWQETIRLDEAQEAVKKSALEAIPAPCCSDNNAYTCCCSCNISRSVWGLANYMIAEQGADADAVRAKAQEWFAYINPAGYKGDACYTGGCQRPFRRGRLRRHGPQRTGLLSDPPFPRLGLERVTALGRCARG